MFIAICDDDKEFCVSLMQKLAQKHRVKIYSDINYFIFEYEDYDFDLLLFDIEMPKMTGLELAHRLRKKQDETPIIFLTNYRDYALDSFDVKPYHYLLKPVDMHKLDRLLEEISQGIEAQWSDCLNLMSRIGTVRIPLSSIIYMESSKHMVHIHTPEFCHKRTAKLDNLEKQCDSRFMRPHKSFLVNILWIESITNGVKEIHMINGKVIPISHRKKAAFVAQIREYDDKHGEIPRS